MAITKTEKYIVSILFVSLIATIVLVVSGYWQVKNNGGVRQTIIDAGREVKDIGKEIMKE